MEELFYFKSYNLLIKAKYSAETNSLRYSTHRPISLDERKVIDRYILNDIAPHTDYYKNTPSLLMYMGVDLSLEKELRNYRLHDTIKDVLIKRNHVEKKVKKLISDSMSQYYFDRLGDELVKFRRVIEHADSEDTIDSYLIRIEKLLDAYNQHSGKSIDLVTILPKEAKEHIQNCAHESSRLA
ncbi:hypothetical protein JW935_04400 [candidate division KSB1 bacterium]|nr:hypothetical protein [candidate division KSB1 bacterium]